MDTETRILRTAAAAAVALAAFGCAPELDPPWIPEGWAPQADDSSRREIAQGAVVGYRHPANPAHVWKGIPYAEPPVGERRWRGAALVQGPGDGSGEGEFLHAAEPCAQWGSAFGSAPEEVHGKVWGSEDCLYLDIYAPAMAPGEVPGGEERLPVMVWIHGGGNTMGTSAAYDFSLLASEQKVVVVAVQYRLGPFGFFSHPALRETAGTSFDLTPNQGILDQIYALVWVERNIAAFGGDPGNVTAFGESAGGQNVMALLASPATQGRMHRAIAQSGNDSSLPVAEAENYADDPEPGRQNSAREQVNNWLVAAGRASDREGAKATQDGMVAADLVAFMQQADAETILQHYSSADQRALAPPPRVVHDRILFLRDTLQASLRGTPGNPQRPANDIPVILGANRDEMKLFTAFDDRFTEPAFFGLRRNTKNRGQYASYNLHQARLWKFRASDRTARRWREAGKDDVWVYRFDWDEEPNVLGTNFSFLLGAAHALEIPFITGDYSGFSPRLAVLFDEYNREGRQWLGKGMRGYWAQFAASGDPDKGSDGTQYAWPQYGEREFFLILDSPPTEFLLFQHGETLEYALGEMLEDQRIDDAMRCEIAENVLRYEEELSDELRARFSYCEQEESAS